MNRIFVQIASYRDSQLYPTIKDCFTNADNPENLVFGVCWQKDESENLYEYEDCSQVKLIKINYKDGKGACWARSMINDLYDGEEYTLQLDSHHRFVKGWDTILKKMYIDLQKKGHQKPLITAYLPPFDPNNDPESRSQSPCKMVFDKLIEYNIAIFLPSFMTEQEKKEPLPGFFFSGHFAFTTGQLCKEVHYDSELYFIGEEISMSFRSYTHGYDIFYPNCLIAWHEYTRKYRTKHWDDDKVWYEKDKSSKQHYAKLLSDKTLQESKYGLGKIRTFEEYSKASDIDFTGKKYECEKDYSFNLKIPPTDNFDFIAIIVESEQSKEVFRKDMHAYTETLTIKFRSGHKPYKWIYYPYYKGTGWGNKTETVLPLTPPPSTPTNPPSTPWNCDK